MTIFKGEILIETTDEGSVTLKQPGAAQENQCTQASLEGLSCGLALSGGGIRSATFCFGLLRALARNKLLTRFGFLSTVSGGGYIGSALGRLYQPDQDAAVVQDRLGRDDTLLLWWLRSNGRYLTPAGARDLGQAFASVLRGVLSTHFEVGVLMLLAAAVILLPYVLMGMLLAQPEPLWRTAGSVWWCLLPLPVFVGCHCIFRYWFCRDKPVQMAGDVVAAALCACVGSLVLYSLLSPSPDFLGGKMQLVTALKTVGAVLLFSPLSAILVRLFDNRSPKKIPKQRLQHTKRLGAALWWLLVFALIGLLDFAAWWLAQQLFRDGKHWGGWLNYATLGFPPALVLVTRVAMPYIKRRLSKMQARPIKTEMVLNVAGMLLVLLLALAWLTVFHALVRPDLRWDWLPLCQPDIGYVSVLHWALLGATSAVYIWFTRKDFHLLNLSSLHNFYRARIERAYVSTGNYAPVGAPSPRRFRFRFAGGSPLNTANGEAIDQVTRLIEAIEGDDVDLTDYKPQDHGGPVHLITCCINQSVDDRTGNYNADRKGIALTVSSLGVEKGTNMPTLPVPGKLSRWAGISGAAASSGMGSHTSPGLAALMFLSGLRLGYWTENLLPPQKLIRSRLLPVADRMRKTIAARFPKPSFLLAELLARFPGLRSTAWYVSDGGHFENTGVYALLKRKLDLIVVADCGADPSYAFADLENLARKAEIDYDAHIEFIDPAILVSQSRAQNEFYACVGTCKSITAAPGAECFLLARIWYAKREVPGLLMVVKPRMLNDMPLEIAGYAARNISFPQQSTSNQFFDEEQWEAYHQLGLRLGEKLTGTVIAALRADLK